MDSKDLVGTFSIKGVNQNTDHSDYKGVLKLTLDENFKIKAEWNINNLQKQEGIGFFHDDILVINFRYLGEDKEVYKGVVAYRCINKNTLKGFWSEKHGDQTTLGKENCTRLISFDTISAN